MGATCAARRGAPQGPCPARGCGPQGHVAAAILAHAACAPPGGCVAWFHSPPLSLADYGLRRWPQYPPGNGTRAAAPRMPTPFPRGFLSQEHSEPILLRGFGTGCSFSLGFASLSFLLGWNLVILIYVQILPDH